MKSLLRPSIACLVVLSASTLASAQTLTVPDPSRTGGSRPIACLSPQLAFSASEMGKTAIARITAVRDEKARQIDEKNRALQTEEQALQRSAAETAFLAKLKPAVEKIAREKNVQIVFNLDEGLILWADQSLDITPDVIKELGGQ